MTTQHGGSAEVTLKKEQAYIRRQLGVEEDDSAAGYASSCDELDEVSSQKCSVSEDDARPRCPGRVSVMSSDGGYVSSDEEKAQENRSVSVVVEPEDSCVVNEIVEKYNLEKLPLDLQKLIEGINHGIPNDFNVPIDKKPDWLDMKLFKIGQQFAQKYYFGLNYSEMLSLLILFSFPDALQPLIFTKNSGTPFTAFRRYLSTVMRVKSWFEHDVWSEGSLGYRNLKTVRAMHLNISKRLNSTAYAEIKNQMTLMGSSDAGVWCPLNEKIKEDFQSCCPFQAFRPIDDERPGKLFVNQLDMSITQFGFVGLMITYPERFGAGNATEEELEGFVHLWRGLGYLLGIEDKYNFCNGSLEDVRSRCHYLIDNWAKPSFQHVSDDWEHMSRCLVEGIGYYVPGVSFEVSLLYLCWVLAIPAPRLHAALSWGQYLMFLLTKMTMSFTLRIPGMLPLHNWLIRRSLDRAASMSDSQLKKLESKTYDYEKNGKFNTRL